MYKQSKRWHALSGHNYRVYMLNVLPCLHVISFVYNVLSGYICDPSQENQDKLALVIIEKIAEK
jgi:hypothetical protein